MIKLSLTEEKILIEDLENLERALNISLPNSYKELMIEFNGGIPEKEYFKGGYGISTFYPIKNGENNIEIVMETIQDILPKDFFPFGDDMGGNDFCIDLSEENYGKVYLIIWEDDDPVFLTNSFEEFLEGLTEIKEDF